MASKIEICNRALKAIRRKPIQAFTDETPEGRECAFFYEPSVRELLAVHDWAFATTTSPALAQHAEDPPVDWAYRYQLPADVEWPRVVLTDGLARESMLGQESDRVPFRLELRADLTEKTLLTDVSPAYLRYTFFCDDPSLYDAVFTAAVVYKLAADLAMSLNEDGDTEARMLQRSAFWMGEARVQNRVSEFDARPMGGAESARGA